MDAGFPRREIGDHRELTVEDRLLAVEIEPHDAFDRCDAGAIDRKPNRGFFFLAVRVEMQRARFAYDPRRVGTFRQLADREAGDGIDQLRRNLGERNEIERALREIGMRHLEAAEVAGDAVDEQDVDVDRPRSQVLRPLPANRELDVANEAFERHRFESRRSLKGEVQERRTGDARRRRRLIER